MAGAPIGNKNGAKAKVWTAAIERALAKRSAISRREAIDDLAEKLLAQCDEGNMTALQELGNRLEGKPTVVIAGDEDNPIIITRIERRIVNTDNQDG